METKRKRQLINRAAGFTGSFMPLERATSIAKAQGLGVHSIPKIRQELQRENSNNIRQ